MNSLLFELMRPLYYVLDAEGNAMGTRNQRAANRLLLDAEARRIGLTTFTFRGVQVEVSTIFLVLDHSFLDGPPVLWESMAFVTGKEFLNGWQRRYRSREDAVAGHGALVAEMRQALKRHPQSVRRMQVARKRETA